MKLRINGEEKDFEEPLTIEALLGLLEIETKGTAVEVNKEVVPRSRHCEVSLTDGDAIEIITMFGGG